MPVSNNHDRHHIFSALAIVSFVLSIATYLFIPLFIFGSILNLGAMVFGIIALRHIKHGVGKGLALIGVLLGALGIIYQILAIVAVYNKGI